MGFGSLVLSPGFYIAQNAAAADLMLDTEQWALLDATLDQFVPVGASLLPAGQARDVETGK